MLELVAIVILGTTIWVMADASNRGMSPWTWGAGCLLLWIVAFPYYLVQRQKAPVLAARMPGTPEGRWKPDPMAPDAVERWHDGRTFTGHTRAKQGE
jgi:hypothetical protein